MDSADDTYQARAQGLAELLRWWRTEIAIPADAPASAKSASIYDLEDVEVACGRVADSYDSTSLEAALRSLASRADAARRLAEMFHSFRASLSGRMLELVTETERLLDNLSTGLIAMFETGAESLDSSERTSAAAPKNEVSPIVLLEEVSAQTPMSTSNQPTEEKIEAKTGDRIGIVLKIGAGLVALGLLIYAHVLTALGALLVLACLAIEAIGWLKTLPKDTWVRVISATKMIGLLVALLGWTLSSNREQAAEWIVLGAVLMLIAASAAFLGWLLTKGWRLVPAPEPHRRVAALIQVFFLLFDIAIPFARALGLIGNVFFLVGILLGEARGTVAWLLGQGTSLERSVNV